MNDTLIVTVTYNSAHLISSFLRNLLNGREAASGRVVVVDSGSSDAERTRRSVDELGSVFVSLPNNVGYGSASNVGSQYSDSEWIAMVNPDVRVTLGDIENLVADAQQYGFQCIGPNVVDEEGVLQQSWHGMAAPPWRRRSSSAERQGEAFRADSVSGCCMVIQRNWFEKLGGFDESFFMFCEEIDLHKRLSEAGGKIGVSNRVRVTTPGGASSLGTTKRWSNVERSIAHVQFTTKHYSKLEGTIDALWRLGLIVTKDVYRPRTASLKQFTEGIWNRVLRLDTRR
ncbi:glycosyltransferase [Arthrobacter sp. B10-11]|uniref:glycosyltransferase n=1 Tax=Arthrobacter sp. B10-11 TaxID=3081160 RepID=UPI00295353E6|nr:glycosyltransferase [Arthrobacter sp. B10-11]MDV8146992.1 glycosyltransferase [Arthrobacter sp. B10-11]